MLEGTEGLPMDLPPAAEAALAAVGAAWNDTAHAEALIGHALAAAPTALAVRMGAYKFYFYKNRLAEALPHAEACLAIAATSLGLPEDWRCVTVGDPALDEVRPFARFWLQALVAVGYVLARLDRLDEAKAALSIAAAADIHNRLGVARLLETIERGGLDEDDA
jgi:hypothetical protein